MSAQVRQPVEPQVLSDDLDYDFSGDDATQERKREFIQHLIDTHTIYVAASRTGIHRSTPFRWKDNDANFAKAMSDALNDSTEVLETCMYERAKQKDTLAGIFLLKKYNPEFRDRMTVDLELVQDEIRDILQSAPANNLLLPPVTTTFVDGVHQVEEILPQPIPSALEQKESDHQQLSAPLIDRD